MIPKAVIPHFTPLAPEGEQIPLLDAGAPIEKKKRAKVKGKRALERSMDKLRDDGYKVGKTEHWNPFVGILQDLFGFIDLIAIGHGKIVAVQVTKGKLEEHIEKICKIKEAKIWIECRGEIRIHLWRERQRNGEPWWDLEVFEVKP